MRSAGGPLLRIDVRAAEALDEEIAQTKFGGGEVVFGIHRAEDRIVRHAPIKGRDQPGEAFVADDA